MWRDFCAVAAVEAEHCFDGIRNAPRLEALLAEANLLAAFVTYVVNYPRKGQKERNSVAYAQQALSMVRSFCEDRIGHRPGLDGAGAGYGRIRAVNLGLRKMHPQQASSRRPILQQHLRVVRVQLDFRKQPVLRVFWALGWRNGWVY